jgi:hypothetical protein
MSTREIRADSESIQGLLGSWQVGQDSCSLAALQSMLLLSLNRYLSDFGFSIPIHNFDIDHK